MSEEKKATTKIQHYIDVLSKQNIKKAKLVEKWLLQYINYLEFEAVFDPQKMIKYPRGSIIFVNLGFNIHKEYGGSHYCIVLDKKDTLKNPVLNVIPLTSKKGNAEKLLKHKTNLDLGTGVYQALFDKISSETKKFEQKKNELQIQINNLNLVKDGKHKTCESQELYKLLAELTAVGNMLNERLKSINNLKDGSIAIVNQITTVSKMRIYNPTSSNDSFFNIRLSNKQMDDIDKKIMELFVKTK